MHKGEIWTDALGWEQKTTACFHVLASRCRCTSIKRQKDETDSASSMTTSTVSEPLLLNDPQVARAQASVDALNAI